MNIFPSNPKPRINGTGGSKEFHIIESKFENNFSQTRRGATRGIRTFELNYDAVTFAEYNTLEAFFDANAGANFLFVDPETSVTHTVKFVDTKLTYKYISNTRKNTSITLVEV